MAVREWIIERLTRSHDRDGFDCGQASLSSWLTGQATQSEDRDLARVYVATRPGEDRVLGYYSISSNIVRCASFPEDQAKKLPPRMDIPGVLIGKLAVDRTVHGRGLGGSLLIDAMRRVLGFSDGLGIRVLVVDAIDDQAKRFYEHLGFLELQDDPKRLFVSMTMIRKLDLSSPAE